jgi:hypothetical protein
MRRFGSAVANGHANKGDVMALVIQEWFASERPNARGEYVVIRGRQEGLISYLMSALGIDPGTCMHVTGDHIIFEHGSIAGFERRLIPLSAVSSTFFSYKKPIQEAIAVALVLRVPTFGLGVIIAIVYYFLNKRLALGFVEISGVANAISFKRSVIEGQKIDEAEGARVVAILEQLVREPNQPARLHAAE